MNFLFLIFFFVLSFQQKINIEIRKSSTLIQSLFEESYQISGFNNLKIPLSEIKFKLKTNAFTHLRIIIIQDQQLNRNIESNIIKNNFKINFDQPIEPQQAFYFKVNIYLYNIYEFKPKKIKMTENQMVEFNSWINNLEFEDLIHIDTIDSDYFLPVEGSGFQQSQIARVEKLQNGYQRYFLKELKNLQNEKIKFYFKMNNPFTIFTDYKKTLQVSLWGNIQENNTLTVKNEGATLDGEYSNVDFNPTDYKTGTNVIRWISVELPGELSGLSITDEIGNVTKAQAKKNNDKIYLNIIPRFPIFGSWKSNWFIDYSMSTTRFLHRNLAEKTHYRLKYQFSHIFELILAKEFQLHICLPEFSEIISEHMPLQYIKKQTYKNYSYFDIFGKNCHQYNFKNILPQIMQGDVVIEFYVPQYSLWCKLAYLISVLLFIIYAIIYLSKVELNFDKSQQKIEHKKKLAQLILYYK